MKTNPSAFAFTADATGRPVEGVSWHDAVAFRNALSRADGRSAAYDTMRARIAGSIGYRLPSEAEWEYVAPATSTAPRYDALENVAWFEDDSKVNGVRQMHPSGLTLPNAFGLFDMLGNVFDWTADWFAPYPLDDASDPTGPANGKVKVYRGGAWGFVGRATRAAFRGNIFAANQRSYWLGVRSARSIGP